MAMDLPETPTATVQQPNQQQPQPKPPQQPQRPTDRRSTACPPAEMPSRSGCGEVSAAAPAPATNVDGALKVRNDADDAVPLSPPPPPTTTMTTTTTTTTPLIETGNCAAHKHCKLQQCNEDDDDENGVIAAAAAAATAAERATAHREENVADEDIGTSARDDSSGCVHYKRKAKFVTPCCGKFYKCRYCHDENEEHHFDRKTLTELICTQCDTRQKVQAECEQCGVRFGKYTCLICNLFDDEDKDQYHCHGCGICRLGGRSNFFHCEVCNMCLPIQLRTDGHKCVENISRSNCPVCLGDIHTSRIPCHIPDCGHLLHKTCFDQLLASGHYVCPTCQTSMIDMKKLWDYLDVQALNIPVPKSYQNSSVNIFCNDCFKQSTVKFHFVGLKCGNCGGYNTSQNMQKRSWNNSKDNPSTSA